MQELGRELEFEPTGDAVCTDAPGERKTILYTLTKDLWIWKLIIPMYI